MDPKSLGASGSPYWCEALLSGRSNNGVFAIQGDPKVAYLCTLMAIPITLLSHPEERMVCCQAGSAVVINQNVFMETTPITVNDLEDAYRLPTGLGRADCRCGSDGPARVKTLPKAIQPFFRSRYAKY